MKTAEEILFNNVSTITFGKLIGTPKELVIKAMQEHTRQALIEFRKECAEKADIKYVKKQVKTSSWGDIDDGVYAVDKDSILSLDIERYLK